MHCQDVSNKNDPLHVFPNATYFAGRLVAATTSTEAIGNGGRRVTSSIGVYFEDTTQQFFCVQWEPDGRTFPVTVDNDRTLARWNKFEHAMSCAHNKGWTTKDPKPPVNGTLDW